MKIRSSSTLFAAMALVGVASVASAQQSFTIPSLEFRDPLTPATTSNNEVVSLGTVGTSYFLGSSIAVASGTLTQIDTAVTASTAGIRLSNSDYPNAWADFTLTASAFVAGTLALASSSRTLSGPLLGARFAAGSSVSAMGYCTNTVTANGTARITGTSLAFSTGSVTAVTNAVAESFAYAGPLQPAIGSTTTVGEVFITSVATSSYLLSAVTRLKTMTITALNTSTFFSEVTFRVQNSAFPSITSSTFKPWNASVGFTTVGAGVPVTFNGLAAGGAITGGLPGSVIPVGSVWQFNPFESFDDGTDLLLDSEFSNLSWDFTVETTIAVSTPVLAGPFVSSGMPYSSGNGTFTIGSAASSFTMAGTIRFSGVGLELNTVTALSQSRLRIRNSAYPGMSAEFQPTGTTLTTTTITNATLTSPNLSASTSLGNALRGMSIPSGSTFTGEFFEIFDDASDDAQWSNVQVTILVGDAIAPATPPATFIDLGVISDASLTTPIAVDTPSWSVAPTFTWFKFTLPSAVNGFDGKFLDMWTSRQSTTGYASDTTITLFDANGRIISFNDDEGGAALAAGSFGLPLQTTPTWAVTTADLPFGGRNGDGIPAGVYYVAVAQFGGTRADGFNVTGSTTTNLGTRFHVRTNVQGNVDLTGSLNLNDTSGTFAFNRNISYSVMQGTTVIASGTVVADASSESFSISVPASATGAATIEWDGSSFLMRKTNINLTGSNLAVGSVSVQNGDVDNSGEVDAVDIDEVIADFGDTSDNSSDVDVSGEVDAADIDIVIANFGGVND